MHCPSCQESAHSVVIPDCLSPCAQFCAMSNDPGDGEAAAPKSGRAARTDCSQPSATMLSLREAYTRTDSFLSGPLPIHTRQESDVEALLAADFACLWRHLYIAQARNLERQQERNSAQSVPSNAVEGSPSMSPSRRSHDTIFGLTCSFEILIHICLVPERM